MSIEWLEEINDPTVAKIMETYNKVLEILKEDCKRKWVNFMAFWYFRKWDNITDAQWWYYYNMSDLDQFDAYLIEKKLKHLFAYENE